MTGPFFDGRADAAVSDLIEDASELVAREGNVRVHERFGITFQHPTGNYASKVRVEQRGSMHVVQDGGSVYGPWLEGTGSRNRATRFKGYAAFRIVTQRLRSEAGRIVAPIVPRFVGRMQ